MVRSRRSFCLNCFEGLRKFITILASLFRNAELCTISPSSPSHYLSIVGKRARKLRISRVMALLPHALFSLCLPVASVTLLLFSVLPFFSFSSSSHPVAPLFSPSLRSFHYFLFPLSVSFSPFPVFLGTLFSLISFSSSESFSWFQYLFLLPFFSSSFLVLVLSFPFSFNSSRVAFS